MAYYTTDLTYVGATQDSGGIVVRVRTSTHQTKAVQVYVSGRLADIAFPTSGTATFHLPVLRASDTLFFLAVDQASAGTDYFAEAFTVAATTGNRIKASSPQLVAGYRMGDKWRVYLGDAGDAVADELKHEQLYYPGGRRAGGYGYEYGNYAYGWDAYDQIGYGYNYGYGEYGWDCQMLDWTSDPLPPGTYPLKVEVTDRVGNESTAYTTTVTLTTYARPNSSLAVKTYDPDTDTLTLSFTESEDV